MAMATWREWGREGREKGSKGARVTARERGGGKQLLLQWVGPT